MPSARRFQGLGAIRLATFALPPLGIILLWKSREQPLRRKILGTIFGVLFLVPYFALIVLILMKTTGLEVEWRGGFPPVLTWHKTHPNYEAVEESRRAQTTPRQPPPKPATPPYWTGFRGPHRDGIYTGQPINTNWSAAGLPLLWKEPVGGGYASFAVAEGMAFTIEQRKEKEVVAAYHVENGQEIWTYGYDAFFTESMGGDGPRATPTYDDGHIYSLGALGDLCCLDAQTGHSVWRLNILTDNRADNLHWAVSSSPLIVGEKLIVQAGGPAGHSVVAYDKLTGKAIWRALDDGAAYSSPMLVDLAGQPQLVVVHEKRATGLTVAKGELLWSFPWTVNLGNRNIAQPIVLSTNRLFLSAGYATGCAAFEIERASKGFEVKPLWQNKNLKNKFTSSVFYDGHIYGLDEDILVCLNANTGERDWKDGRYGYGQLLLAGDHLIILGGQGELALVQATPMAFHELARFQAIQGKTWNHPALAD